MDPNLPAPRDEASFSSRFPGLLPVLLFGALIRFFSAFVPRLNIDEGFTYYLCQEPWNDLYVEMMRDRHPIFFTWLFRHWLNFIHPSVAGVAHDEFLMRLPFVLFALVTIFATYMIARECVSTRVAAPAAAFVALAFPVWEHDTWLRGQGLFGPLAALSSYLFLRLCRNPDKVSTLSYALCCALMMNVHYWGCLIVFSHVCCLAFERSRPLLLHFLGAMLILGAICLPMVSLLRIQLQVRGSVDVHQGGSWPAAGMMALKLMAMDTGLENFLGFLGLSEAQRTSIEPAYFLLTSVLVLSCLFVGSKCLTNRVALRRSLILGCTPTMMLLVMVGWKFNELCRPRYYVVMAPYLGLFLASACFTAGTRAGISRALLAWIAVVNLMVVYSYQMSPYFRSADWKTPALWISQRVRQVQLVATTSSPAMLPLGYYLLGLNMRYDLSDPNRPHVVSRKGVAVDRFDTPEQAERGMQGVDRAILGVWSQMAETQNWFSGHYGILEEFRVESFAPDARSAFYLLQAWPRDNTVQPHP